MNATHKSNLKRIREILLTDENGTEDDTNDSHDSISDSDYDPDTTESDETSTNEHISQEPESSCSDDDDDRDDIHTNSQPETLEKVGITWSTHSGPARGRIPVENIMKKKPGAITTVQTFSDTFKLFFTNEILDHVVFHTNLYAERYFDQNQSN